MIPQFGPHFHTCSVLQHGDDNGLRLAGVDHGDRDVQDAVGDVQHRVQAEIKGEPCVRWTANIAGIQLAPAQVPTASGALCFVFFGEAKPRYNYLTLVLSNALITTAWSILLRIRQEGRARARDAGVGTCKLLAPKSTIYQTKSTWDNSRSCGDGGCGVAPLYVTQLKQAEDVHVIRRLVEVYLHELYWVRVDARHRLADIRQDVVQRILLGPAQCVGSSYGIVHVCPQRRHHRAGQARKPLFG